MKQFLLITLLFLSLTLKAQRNNPNQFVDSMSTQIVNNISTSNYYIELNIDTKDFANYFLNKTDNTWNIITLVDNEITLTKTYKGDYKGLFPFGNYWQEKAIFTVVFNKRSNRTLVRITCELMERKNARFPWLLKDDRETTDKYVATLIYKLYGN